MLHIREILVCKGVWHTLFAIERLNKSETLDILSYSVVFQYREECFIRCQQRVWQFKGHC